MKFIEEYQKQKENELIEVLEKKFPTMIEKNQCIYIKTLIKHMPRVVNELQKRWEVEFKYDEKTQSKIWFMCPKYKK